VTDPVAEAAARWRARKRIGPSLAERVRSRVVVDGGHWLWPGARQVRAGSGLRVSPRRVLWVAFFQEPPGGRLQAACGVSACVRPSHQNRARS